MGFFDFFRARRERESVLENLDVTPTLSGGAAEASVDAQAQPEEAQPAGGFDLSHIGQIGQMIAAAQQSGSIQVQNIEPGQMQGLDFDSSGLRDEIMGIMREHGIDPRTGATQEFSAAEMPAMQQQILDALGRHGLNFGQGWQGGTPGSGPAPDSGLPPGWDPAKQVNPPGGADPDA